MKRILIGTFLSVIASTIFGIASFAQTPSRARVLKDVESRREELTALEKSLLAPSEEDRIAYATLLRQSDTGIIRLIPRENKLTIGGAYYSFTRLTHEYGSGSDISLEQDFLSVGFAGADYGMLTNIGDVSLEDITLEHPSVGFLSEYVPASKELDARSEYRRFSSGETIGGMPYKNRLPVEVKATYLLRSIDYNATDVLVAFKVVRKDIDRSVVIVWKLVKKYPKPDLARANEPVN